MPRFKFEKLVRDKIIDHQQASGAKPTYHRLSPDDHKKELVRKIMEEASEISTAAPDKIASELADVQQALDDLRELYHLSPKDVEQAQTVKNQQNGTFQKGLYINYVDIDETDKWVDYYRENSDRYPEVDPTP